MMNNEILKLNFDVDIDDNRPNVYVLNTPNDTIELPYYVGGTNEGFLANFDLNELISISVTKDEIEKTIKIYKAFNNIFGMDAETFLKKINKIKENFPERFL